jgi:hypothetical protein
MIMARVTSALAATTLFALVSYAHAQSLPPEGELHVTFTATQVPPVNPMLVGEGKQYVAQNLIMSASNDQGNAVLNNMGSRCQINRLITRQRPRSPMDIAPTPMPITTGSSNNAIYCPENPTHVS